MKTVMKYLAVGLSLLVAGCDNGASTTNNLYNQPPSLVTIYPTGVTIPAGGAPITFIANAGTLGPVTWSINPQVGALSTFTGTSTTYTPPAFVGSPTGVVLTASVNGGATGALRATAVINIGSADAGTLAVGIGLPQGASASVQVIGISTIPTYDGGIDHYMNDGGWEAFSATLSTSNVLFVPNATYTVDAGFATIPDPLVGTLFWATITGAPAVVNGDSATPFINVTYDQQKLTSNRLWLPTCGDGTLASFTGEQLLNSSMQQQSLPSDSGFSLKSTATGFAGQSCAEAIAFDPAGNLWSVDSKSNVITGFIGRSYSTQVHINGWPGSHFQPKSIAFASNGDLWVANGDRSVLRYQPEQLLSSGAPAPVAIIQSVDMGGGVASLSSPRDLTFDATGNLWVANQNGPVVMYSNVASLLNNLAMSDAGYDIAPVTVLADTSDAGLLNSLNNMSFDPTGNLWLAKSGFGVLEISNPAGLSGVQAPNIAAMLDDSAFSDGGQLYAKARSITFDSSGNLWVAKAPSNCVLWFCSSGELMEITQPGSLSGESTPIPDARITGGVPAGIGRMQFDPPPAGIGLNE